MERFITEVKIYCKVNDVLLYEFMENHLWRAHKLNVSTLRATKFRAALLLTCLTVRRTMDHTEGVISPHHALRELVIKHLESGTFKQRYCLGYKFKANNLPVFSIAENLGTDNYEDRTFHKIMGSIYEGYSKEYNKIKQEMSNQSEELKLASDAASALPGLGLPDSTVDRMLNKKETPDGNTIRVSVVKPMKETVFKPAPTVYESSMEVAEIRFLLSGVAWKRVQEAAQVCGMTPAEYCEAAALNFCRDNPAKKDM